MAHIDGPQTQRANLAFFKAAMKTPLLERDHELQLAEKWRSKSDTRALQELVSSHIRLVISIAGRYRWSGLATSDLVQEGNVGLMQAASRFEPDRGVRFSTYAAWWIRSAIQEYILHNWSIVRTGTTATQKLLFFNLRRLRARLEASSQAPLADGVLQAIADELDADLSEVEAMEMRLTVRDQSLNAPVHEDSEDERQDHVPDGRPNPEESAAQRCDGETCAHWLAEAIAALTARERIIVNERWLCEPRATLRKLSCELGVSKERVRQLERRALAKLRQSIQGHTDNPADLIGQVTIPSRRPRLH